NAAFGDAAERAAIAARITVGRGANTNEADIAAVRTEVAKLPLDQLRDLQRAGIKVVACRDSVVDAEPSLNGVRPRGWAPGRTWNDVPGAYMPSSKEVVVATRAGGPTGREVPPLGHNHGSVSLVAHEVGHAVDAARRYPSKNDDAFQAAYQRDLSGGQLLPYYTQAGEAGASEAYAESLAIFLSGDPNGDGARRFPALMNYWNQQYRPESAS
ncbi:MAG: anthrax toxin lethal factor-related metalloendopeptidase, partial [Archangium sp.]